MIFNLFKAKPKLKELIPSGFVDIHSHILPGIDDGAKNISESNKLIKGMKELGFYQIIATPHTYPGLYDNSSESILKSYENIKTANINEVKISCASEYMIGSYLIQKAEKKELLCLKDNFVLIEMSFFSKPINLFDIIFKIRVNGYIPVIAHPERYRFFYNDINSYHKLKDSGCMFQLNLLSTVGFYGKAVLRFSQKLLKENLIDFVGSDIHNKNYINFFYENVKIKNIDNFKKIIKKNEVFKI